MILLRRMGHDRDCVASSHRYKRALRRLLSWGTSARLLLDAGKRQVFPAACWCPSVVLREAVRRFRDDVRSREGVGALA